MILKYIRTVQQQNWQHHPWWWRSLLNRIRHGTVNVNGVASKSYCAAQMLSLIMHTIPAVHLYTWMRQMHISGDVCNVSGACTGPLVQHGILSSARSLLYTLAYPINGFKRCCSTHCNTLWTAASCVLCVSTYCRIGCPNTRLSNFHYCIWCGASISRDQKPGSGHTALINSRFGHRQITI